MATVNDEYNTLRAELLEHQKSRTPILSLALTLSVTLFGVSVSTQFGNPYLPLFALVLLSAARVQITQAQYGAQRIASYIRVIIENEGKNPDLHWETGSYEIRRTSITKRKRVWNLSPVTSIDWILLSCSLVAIGLALSISLGLISGHELTPWPFHLSFFISVGSAILWLLFWLLYNKRVAQVQLMEADDKEAQFWRNFKITHNFSSKK